MISSCFVRIARWALPIALVAAAAGPALAGPVFDPFLERFQVGVHADPDKIPVAAGFPMGRFLIRAMQSTATSATRVPQPSIIP